MTKVAQYDQKQINQIHKCLCPAAAGPNIYGQQAAPAPPGLLESHTKAIAAVNQ